MQRFSALQNDDSLMLCKMSKLLDACGLAHFFVEISCCRLPAIMTFPSHATSDSVPYMFCQSICSTHNLEYSDHHSVAERGQKHP